MTDSTHDTSTSRRRFLQTTAAAGSALAIGGAPLRVKAEPPPTFPLGMIEPFTGSAGEFGPFYRDAAKLAVEDVNNAAKQVMGGPIISEMIVENSNTLPTPATQAARKLVNVNDVPAIICGWSSGVTVAVATSVTIPNEVLQVGNGCTSPLISVLPKDRQADLLFRTTAPDTLQGVVAAQLTAGELVDGYKHQTAAVTYINNPYGQGLANAFARSFQLRGGIVQAMVPHPGKVQPTYTAPLAIALKNNPDVLFIASYPGQSITICKESRDIFDYTSWQFCDGNASTKVLEAVGADTLAGQLGTAPGSNKSLKSYQHFAERFKKRFGYDHIPPFTASAYDAAATIGLAAVQVINQGEQITGPNLSDSMRPVTNKPGKEVFGAIPESMTEAVELIANGKNTDYIGAVGRIDFDKQGDVKVPIEIWKFTEDTIDTVKLILPQNIPAE